MLDDSLGRGLDRYAVEAAYKGANLMEFYQELIEELQKKKDEVAYVSNLQWDLWLEAGAKEQDQSISLVEETYIPNTWSRKDIWVEITRYAQSISGTHCQEIIIQDPYGLNLELDDVQHLQAFLQNYPFSNIILVIDKKKLKGKQAKKDAAKVIFDLSINHKRLIVWHNEHIHDREIIIDGQALHIGCSMNGYGKRDFRISPMDEEESKLAYHRIQSTSKPIKANEIASWK